MKKITSFIVLLFVLANCSYGQKVEKVFLNSVDSTTNCYLIIYPTKLPCAGFLFLIPSFGEKPEVAFNQTDLPKVAAEKGILTIIPTFSTGVLSLGIDSLTQNSLIEILTDVTNKHQLTDHPFFIGGFSIGGSCAIKYAEMAISENLKHKPIAVFGIDPPLDFERLYNSSKRTIRLGFQSPLLGEAYYMVNRLEKEIGGSPQTALQNYYKLSPYSYSDTTQTAIKSLIDMPIRIYSEPDIHWWINNRGSDLHEMNVLDASAMINELKILGNPKATLILTENKGYRQPGNRRHPHSWSIVDSAELVKWLLDISLKQ